MPFRKETLIAYFRVSIFFISSIACLTTQVKADELNVAFLSVGPEQTKRLQHWFKEFERKYPNTKINLQTYDDAVYKEHVRSWLESEEFDVVYGQAGYKLIQLIDLGLLTPVSSIIDKSKLQEVIQPSVLSQVRIDEFIYGLPLAHYPWGFYYNKTIFSEYNIAPPTSWDDFVNTLEKLEKNGVTPLVQANKEGWEPLFWLDMLSLATGGETLRKKLIKNEALLPFEQEAITHKFAEITAQNRLLNPQKSWSWQETISAVSEGNAAMTVMGSFAEPLIQNTNNDRIGYFPFPGSFGKSLVAPLDLFVIPTASTKKDETKKLLSFLLQPEVLSQLAFDLGWFPVTKTHLSGQALNERQQKSLEYLSQTPLHAHYFDREADPVYSLELGDKLAEAMATQTPQTIFTISEAPTLPEPKTSAISDDKTIHISAIKGHKATFLASQLMARVYQSVGYDIEVKRFDTSEEAIKAHEKEMDADLLRVQYFETKNPLLRRVPEPVISAWIYMVMNKKYCDGSNVDYSALSNVAVGSDAVAFQEWAEQANTKLTIFPDNHKMWRAFKNDEIKALLVFEPDLIEHKDTVEQHCRSRVSRTDFFHYVNQRHEDLIPLLDSEIKKLKQRDEYREIIRRFGVR
ncbi:extracellular solute-binding protein [Alteromonadaceae bacterium M269]|nr:extracellular solute-binding protein [Alteromonadaceae bacterium M269]